MLCIEDIRFAYPKGEDVLCGLSLSVSGVVCVLGPSGCGKSTLINVAAGLLMPSSGSVLLDGKSIDTKEAAIGLIPQDGGLLPWLTVMENAMLGLSVRNRPIDEEKMEKVLTQLGIWDLRAKKPQQISGGQRQRVAVARALAMDARLLLLDEPFSALDAYMREEAQDFLRLVVQQAVMDVLLVTHCVEEAAVLGQTIAVMGRGNILHSIKNPVASRPIPREATDFMPLCNSLRDMVKKAGCP